MKSIVTSAVLAMLAASVSTSWVPMAPVLPERHEPRWQTEVKPRADNSSTNGWPYAPFKTQGRDVVDSNGNAVTWAGVNWPMSGKCQVVPRFTE
jgi:hypothetical protein